MKEAIEKINAEIQALKEQKECYQLPYIEQIRAKKSIQRDINALKYSLTIINKA